MDYSNVGVYFLQYSYYYQYLENDNEPYYAAIYNQNGGTLNISNLYVGIGAHFSVLYNRGRASIQGMYTEFSQNGSAYYDPWNLRLSSVITNDFGTLYISDSDIVGADKSLIDIYGGTAELDNVTLAQSMMGITTYYSAESISMNNVNLYEVGKFYTSIGAAVYFYNDYYQAVFDTAPCHLAADSVTLESSKFSYIDSFGVITISAEGISDSPDDSAVKSLEFNNNHFTLTLVPGDQYDGYSYSIDFSALQLIQTKSLGVLDEVKDRVVDFIEHAQSANIEDSTGLIVIGTGYEFALGNNEILVGADLKANESNYMVDPYLYIDSGRFADGCIAGNILENIDIVVNSGNIKSCKHYGVDSDKVK